MFVLLHKTSNRRDDSIRSAARFARVATSGDIKSAIHFLNKEIPSGCLLLDDVIDEETSETMCSIMLKKHPEERPVLLDAIVPQPSIDGSPHPVVFGKITAQCIRRIAMRSEGAACPSGADAYDW